MTYGVNPELCFEEKYSHDALCLFLEKQGFPVERHYVLDTAFKSSVGENEVREHDGKHPDDSWGKCRN